jgi:hypothetical protein
MMLGKNGEDWGKNQKRRRSGGKEKRAQLRRTILFCLNFYPRGSGLPGVPGAAYMDVDDSTSNYYLHNDQKWRPLVRDSLRSSFFALNRPPSTDQWLLFNMALI